MKKGNKWDGFHFYGRVFSIRKIKKSAGIIIKWIKNHYKFIKEKKIKMIRKLILRSLKNGT